MEKILKGFEPVDVDKVRNGINDPRQKGEMVKIFNRYFGRNVCTCNEGATKEALETLKKGLEFW